MPPTNAKAPDDVPSPPTDIKVPSTVQKHLADVVEVPPTDVITPDAGFSYFLRFKQCQ
jgi:hypothetical protein